MSSMYEANLLLGYHFKDEQMKKIFVAEMGQERFDEESDCPVSMANILAEEKELNYFNDFESIYSHKLGLVVEQGLTAEELSLKLKIISEKVYSVLGKYFEEKPKLYPAIFSY